MHLISDEEVQLVEVILWGSAGSFHVNYLATPTAASQELTLEGRRIEILEDAKTGTKKKTSSTDVISGVGKPAEKFETFYDDNNMPHTMCSLFVLFLEAALFFRSFTGKSSSVF